MQEFFDQNPISQLGIIVTKNKRADVVCELGGNPIKIIEVRARLTRELQRMDGNVSFALSPLHSHAVVIQLWYRF